MNKSLITIILVVACLGLAIALIAVKSVGNKQQENQANTILDFSNQLTSARDQITGLSQVNLLLTNDLAASRETATTLSNQLADAVSAIARDEQQITNLDDRVSDLEAKNKALDDRNTELTNTIAQLDTEITTTQMKLANSETNNAFLESELKKQVAERTALEQKFNNLSQVREQVHKLKDEALVALRLQWMREGTDPSRPQPKGGQLLMQHTAPASTSTAHAPANNELNVEVESGGAVRVIPPPTSATNSPPQ